ncbi:MAG: glucoamylase family protein [Acidobacteriota bacterium]
MPRPSEGQRLAIAFFAGDAPQADAAYETLRRRHHLVERLSQSSPERVAKRSPYAHLRLPDESLLAAWINVSDLAATIDTLQTAGARSIFLTAGGLPALESQDCLQFGSTLVRTHDIHRSIDQLQASVQRAREYLVESVRLGHLASPAAQWILDNAYLISLTLGELRKELPVAFKSLPVTEVNALKHLATQLVTESGARINEERLREFLDDIQRAAELNSIQLWSFPLLLRTALIEQLTGLACRSNRVQQLREVAFLWADRLALSSVQGPEVLEQMVARLQAEPFANERSFAVALTEQLQDQEQALQVVHSWTERQFGASLEELVRAEHEREAADSLLASNAFNSLKALSQIDFKNVFEAVSRAEAILQKDPAGVYPQSDFATRDHCRQIVARIARQAGKAESEVAWHALEMVRLDGRAPTNDVLFYLIAGGVETLELAVGARIQMRQRILRSLRRHAAGVYLGSIGLLTACFLAVVLKVAWDAGIQQPFLLGVLGTLTAFPLSELVTQMVHSLLINTFPPESLPKMDFKRGIPEDAATLIVVPIMLSSAEAVRREAEKLEIRYLANRHQNLSFSLLSDYQDAAEPALPSDQPLLKEAKQAIADLNRKYGDAKFLLFHRPRTWSPTEQLFIGRERKRGKIEELCALLCGHGDPGLCVEGSLPQTVRYLITLDADTQVPPGTALRLIETIAHPLNRVEINPKTRVRESGFTIIQPRVSIALPGANATRFTRVFSDTQGTDPYCTVVSDAQQDLFLEGIFHGKAIIDVPAFDRILRDRFPVETILSHDLIEGAYVGVGFASDINLLENVPLDYPGYAKRQHRWIRGDWQIAVWATLRVPGPDGSPTSNPLSLLNRWRIFDNLRRSLVPIASLLLVGFGWFFSVAPAVWSIVLALTVGIPAVVPILDRWTRHIEGSVHGWQGAVEDLERAATMVAFLPHQAWLSVDAIVRACHRRVVSKRSLLEWQTSDTGDTQRSVNLESTLRQMLIIAGAATVALVVMTAKGFVAPAVAYLCVWIGAPWLMRWLGGSGPASWSEPLGRSELSYLRAVARRTWRFFDDLVGDRSHWLPPDNSQLALRVEVANRTSPTNIGLWLNSAMAAQDLGFLTSDDFVQRCSATMETLKQLQRYEGHLLNWYDTDTLQPLLPQYVSTVDSGNLIASLWVTAQACRECVKVPIVGPMALSGLGVTVGILRESAGNDPSLAVPLQGLLQTARSQVDGIERIGQLRLLSFHSGQLKAMKRWSPLPGDEMTYWALKLASELDSWSAAIDLYLSWMELLSGPSDEMVRSLGEPAVELRRQALKSIPSLQELSAGSLKPVAALLAWRGRQELRPEVADWLETVNREYRKAQEAAQALIQKLESLALQASQFADGIDMGFLYDSGRRLFGIGYAVGNPVTFASHYDLLASECRLASLVSIAKGDIPIEHWFVLGRPRVSTPTRKALLSWSGTMFEYLMPLLFTEAFENTLLAHACDEAVEAQIVYGVQNGLPWGNSEAAYSALDGNKIYQYRAFGVPALALNPNADPGPVVTPYATVLALMVRPQEACENLHRLESAGLAGAMGFYESIDYTRLHRAGDDKPGVPIFAYMAHHQGMSLVALNNTLNKNVVRRRFHADLRVRAVESLLFERVPIARVEAREIPRPRVAIESVAAQQRRWTKRTVLPRVHLNSNGRYSLMVTNSGGGYSRWKGFDITRWRSDAVQDRSGFLVWIKDLRSGLLWSPAAEPAGDVGESSVTFASDRAEFSRRIQDLETKVEVAVATDDDAEVRRLTISNRSLRSRTIELTTYAELALAPHAADCAHPAFSKMFVETELFEEGVLIAHRRTRSPEDPPIWVATLMIGFEGTVEFETDRRRFVGRGQNVNQPVALSTRLGGTTGAVLDPIFSLRNRLTLEPRDQRVISFITIAAQSREDLISGIRKYQRPDAVSHAFEMIWTRAQLEFRFLRIGPQAAHRFQDLAGFVLYPSARLRPRSEKLELNRLSQSALWKYGISGDLPILVVTVADDQGEALVREVLLAHSYWRMLGLDVDLVILNREAASYDAPLRKNLDRMLHAHRGSQTVERAGNVYVLDWQSLPPQDQGLLLSVARVVLGGHLGPLQQQLLSPVETAEDPAAFAKVAWLGEPAIDETPALSGPEVVYGNGLGGFTQEGREYVVDLKDNQQTPAPWANVIANEHFGTVVTESGLGFTWNRNSQMNRLTPWHNDPVSDPQGEAVYLRDEDTGGVWTPTPLPIREGSPYRIRHGQGHSSYEHHSRGLRQRLTVFAALQDPVKIMILRLTNDSKRPRRLTATYYAEWVLGSIREQSQVHVTTKCNAQAGVMFARQSWSEAFSSLVAFAASSPKAAFFSGDRGAFFGRADAAETPAGLTRQHLDNRCGAGLDPCSALQVEIEIEPGGSCEVVFLLGQAESEAEGLEIVRRFSEASAAHKELQLVMDSWGRRLDAIQVTTPCPTADILLNHWLLYQSLGCRIWARSAIYQSGGAIGFRDQLQDCLALIYSSPEMTRAHILRAAARQFTEGDVQHWWHAETGMGVRTRCSDDLLWLPWAVARYVEVTGDAGILDEPVPFLEGPALEEHEHEKMFTPVISAQIAPLRDHCVRAIEHGSSFGVHGLPLIGNGDWNDGLNRVGIEGRGESVWLAWFLVSVLDAWIRLMEQRDAALAKLWRNRARALSAAVETNAWDGDWYLRGYFDDGTPLGSRHNTEAQIDSLPQSWAVLSGRGTPDHAAKGMASARERLVRPNDGLVLLFTPPFNSQKPHPGYIMGYPPGTRENGGQYTHAALWLAQAFARQGDGSSAVDLLQLINPVERTATPALVAQYRGEPFAVAADVSSSPNRPGAAGWTWYTGSSGWMYRVWIEDVLGFCLRGQILSIKPAIPDHWPGFHIRYRVGAASWDIQVDRASPGRVCWGECDGIALDDCSFRVKDDGQEHHVQIWIGSEEQRSHASRVVHAPQEVQQT